MTTREFVARDRLREIVAAVLEMEPEEIGCAQSWTDDLAMSSLEKVEVITRVQESFELTFSAEEASRIGSVEDALEALESGGGLRPAADACDDDLVERLLSRHLAAGHGTRVAYVDPDVGEVTYDRLHEAVREHAGALRFAGARPGTRGLVVAEDSVATVVAVLGHWWNRSVPVLVSPLLSDDDIAFAARDCAAESIHIDGAEAKRRSLRAAFRSSGWTDGEQVRAALDPAAAHRPEPDPPVADRRAADEVLVQYTSGSTGRPKGVRHSAAGLLAMIDGFGAEFGLRREDVLLSTARMSFGYGFGNTVLCGLAAGATSVLIRGALDPYAVISAIRAHRPTVLCSVPRLYASLLGAAQQANFPHDSLRLCVTAGEHCPPALGDRIRSAFGAGLLNCYGATEVMHVVIAAAPNRELPDGSIGFPVPGVSATVRDDSGAEVRDGLDGRLHISGRTVALGYVNSPEEGSSTFADGGVYTGDLVRRGIGGDFHYLCRADDILNLGGYKVVPAEIENVVRSVEGVAECAVIAVLDESDLEQAVACVRPAQHADPRDVRRSVLAAARRELPVHKRPSRVALLPELPTTITGKVSAQRLREQVGRA